MMTRLRAAALAAALAAAPAGCASREAKPSGLGDLRNFLLDKAGEKLEHSFRISTKYSAVPFNQARQQLIYVYVRQGRFDDALGTAEEFLRQNRDYSVERRKILAANEAAWEKKTAGNPDLKESKLAREYEEGRKEVLDQVERAEKTVADMLILQGDIHLRLGKKPEAISRYKEVLDARPSHFAALARLGQAHVSLENWTLAAGYFERAATRIEEVRTAALAQADALNPEDGKDRERITAARDYAASMSPMREAVEVSAGLCHFLGREFDAFSDAFARVLEENPDSAFLQLKIGLALIKDGHATEGKAEIDKFLLRHPQIENDLRQLAIKAAGSGTK